MTYNTLVEETVVGLDFYDPITGNHPLDDRACKLADQFGSDSTNLIAKAVVVLNTIEADWQPYEVDMTRIMKAIDYLTHAWNRLGMAKEIDPLYNMEGLIETHVQSQEDEWEW